MACPRLCICLETNCYPVQFFQQLLKSEHLVWCHKIEIIHCMKLFCTTKSGMFLWKHKTTTFLKKKVQNFHHDKEREIKVEFAWTWRKYYEMVMAKEKKGTKASSFWLVFIPLSLVNFPCRVYMYASLSEIWLRDEKLFFPFALFPETSLHSYSLTHSYVHNNPFSFFENKKFLALFLFVFLNQASSSWF